MPYACNFGYSGALTDIKYPRAACLPSGHVDQQKERERELRNCRVAGVGQVLATAIQLHAQTVGRSNNRRRSDRSQIAQPTQLGCVLQQPRLPGYPRPAQIARIGIGRVDNSDPARLPRARHYPVTRGRLAESGGSGIIMSTCT